MFISPLFNMHNSLNHISYHKSLYLSLACTSSSETSFHNLLCLQLLLSGYAVFEETKFEDLKKAPLVTCCMQKLTDKDCSCQLLNLKIY